MSAPRTPDALGLATFAYEISISAVAYEAALVTELLAELSGRLQSAPVWEGHAAAPSGDGGPTLLADQSRLALVLHQRLWQADESTRTDAILLRERVREHPESVCVMTLDAAPVPSWLAAARCCDLAGIGVHDAAEFALEAVAEAGGSLVPAPQRGEAPASPSRWLDGPLPYLSQPRSQGALRHELDALAVALDAQLADRRARQPDRSFELHVLPHRLIARLDDMAVSFSWLAGRMPLVGDGRMMIIEWSGVASEARGVSPLRSATPRRERVYRAEATDATHWRWRVDDANGRAYSTSHLVAAWLASASAPGHD